MSYPKTVFLFSIWLIFIFPAASSGKIITEDTAWTDEGGHYSLYLPAGTFFIGYAAEFPPGKKLYFYREIHIAAEKKDLDIVVDE